MPAGIPYLGPAGSLTALPSPAPGYAPVDEIRGGTHELLAGSVRDRLRVLRRYTLSWPGLTDDNWATVRQMMLLPGPHRYLDPLERNMLTPNQAHGTDHLRSTEGFSARTQGTISSSTTFFRSGSRAAAWATGSALGSTDRGYVLRTSTTVDATWTAVRPSVGYTISGYLRTSATVSVKAGFEWYDSAGVIIGSAVFGSGVSLSTSNFTTRVTHTATSPSTAAYAVGLFFNSTTTGGAITVYLDEAQIEEAAAVTGWRIGGGTPLVSVDSLDHSIVVADGLLGVAYHAAELQLLELG